MAKNMTAAMADTRICFMSSPRLPNFPNHSQFQDQTPAMVLPQNPQFPRFIFISVMKMELLLITALPHWGQ
jgi:hypothetical protein